MILHSFRARLTLWNVAVLGLVMSGLVFTLTYELRSQEFAAFDRNLTGRARFFEGFVFRTPPWARPGPTPPPGQGPRFEPPARSQPGPGPSQTGGTPPERGASSAPRRDEFRRNDSSAPPNREAEQRRWFSEARIIDAQGHIWGPPGWTPWDAAAFREAMKGRKRFTLSSSREERIRVYSVPVRRDGRIAGVIQVAHELGDFDHRWQSQMRLVFMLLPVSLLIAALGGLFLTNRALQPVRLVTRTAAQIGEEDLSRRLAVSGKDELAELAATFNQMIERLDLAFRSRVESYAQLEAAYEQQKRFTADASHELRTPLTRIKTATSAALHEQQSAQEYRDALGVADRAADSMGRLLDQLLMLARADGGQLRPRCHVIDLGELLQEAVSCVRTREQVWLELPIKPILIESDADMLSRVFVNLIDNSSRHTPAEGWIMIKAAVQNGDAVVSIQDTGEGIPPEHLPHIFERFYRVDASRSASAGAGGTGLGLAICQSIVHVLGGDLVIASEPGQGTLATVSIPLSREIRTEGS
jgi:signal transduction histidine kinase